jgi:hypothetical protein
MVCGPYPQELSLCIEDMTDEALDIVLTLVDEPCSPWRPEPKQAYWTVEGAGTIVEAFWHNETLDQARAALGNCFSTCAHVQRACQKIKEVLVNFYPRWWS